jgi:anti-sigma factor RsiW
MDARIAQPDFEDLSAYLDGELTGERLIEVERRVFADPAWRMAYAELAAVEDSLNSYTVPAADAGLASRIVARVRQAEHRAMGRRVAKWLAGAAAAAACFALVVVAFNREVKPPPVVAGTEVNKSSAYQQMPQADRSQVEVLIVENLGFFKSFDVVQEFETLKAVEQLEQEGT